MPQLTMYPGQVNSPATELATQIDDIQTTIQVLDASILPDAPNIATIGVGENAETILYTSKDNGTNELTGVTRGFQGGARAWNVGIKIRRLFTAYDWDSIRENYELHLADNTSAHGINNKVNKGWSEPVSLTLQSGWTGELLISKNDLDEVWIRGRILPGTIAWGTNVAIMAGIYAPSRMVPVNMYRINGRVIQGLCAGASSALTIYYPAAGDSNLNGDVEISVVYKR